MGPVRGRREDRISELGDGVLGRVLSFLPAKEAARAAALSSRWRGSFAGVHAVSMEEPDRPVPDYDDDHGSYSSYRNCGRNRDPAPPYANSVTAALLARHRRPLLALRVSLCRYCLQDSSAVDQWVSYALKHAAPQPAGLQLDLRLRRVPVCDRAYALRVRPAVGSLKQLDCYDPLPSTEPDRPRSAGTRARRGRTRRRSMYTSSSSSSSSGTSSSNSDEDEEEANRRAMPRRRTYVSDEDDEAVRIPPRRRSISSDGTESNSCSRSRSVSDDTESNSASRSSSVSDDTDSNSVSRSRSLSDDTESNSRSRSRSMSDDTESNSDDGDTNWRRRRRRANRSPAPRPRSPSPPAGEDDDVVSAADEDEMLLSASPEPRWKLPPPEYTVPGRLFSCAVLRSLRIGLCRLSPPAAISMPSLEELLLTRVSDEEGDVQRLVAACPRLADLTLEACGTVTALCLLGNRQLRSLALRCCHNLATVTVDDTLHSIEYRGAVPSTSLLALPRGGHASLTSCKIDICGEEVSSADELTKLGEFLQLLASTKHLHLQSARLGSGFDHDALATLPAFTRLVHLELMGQLPHDEDGTRAVAAVSRILKHAPSLEVLSLVFTTGPVDKSGSRRSWDDYFEEGEPVDAHQLRYNEHEILAAPAVIVPCLRNRVREINLVHYNGGRAQRTLAKFLLCNAPALHKLYCGFAMGPLWIQSKLTDEIHGWAMNDDDPENSIFN